MASHAPTALELRLSRELRVSRRRVKRVGGAALLPLGVITTLASKLAYEMRAHDAPFHKPLFMTLVSFVAMSLCALPQMWHSFRRDARRRDRRRERARLEASRDAHLTRRMREASHDPDSGNPGRDERSAAASDGARGLAEPLLSSAEAFFSDYDRSDRSDGGAAQTLPGASGTYERTVGHTPSDDDDDVRARRRAIFRGVSQRGETRGVASLMSRLAPVAFADVLATALISHAVLRLPLSAFLSLRHFQLVFAAAVATALRRELNPLHKLGVSLSLSGAALVVLSAEIAEADAAGRARAAAGVACLFLSQLTQALALTFETRAAVAEEEAFGAETPGGRTSPRAPRRKPPSPATALGIEGALGTAFLLCVVMPLAQFLSSSDDSTSAGDSTGAGAQRSTRRIVASAAGEDSLDTARALFANRDLSALVVCYLFALAAYNHAGAAVSRVMGVMSRTKLETSRTLLCWALAATLQCGSLGDGANERNENEIACFPGEASVPPRLTAARFAGFVMGTLGTLLYGRGDAAERQRVFERDVTYKRAYASGRGPPRGARRRRGARGGFGGAREAASEDDVEVSGAFFVGGDFAVGDAASEDDVESAARATDARRLSSSTTRGFGSPVGPVGSNARTGLVTASGDEDETRDDENGLTVMKASLEERLSGYGRESGFGSGSLRSSMAFSSFGGEAAPRSAARARVGRSGADASGASGPARVVSGFQENAT